MITQRAVLRRWPYKLQAEPYSYNDAGQLTDIVYVDAEDNPISVETWRYDENGNVDRRTSDGAIDWAIALETALADSPLMQLSPDRDPVVTP